jgi:hypothetical protein
MKNSSLRRAITNRYATLGKRCTKTTEFAFLNNARNIGSPTLQWRETSSA